MTTVDLHFGKLGNQSVESCVMLSFAITSSIKNKVQFFFLQILLMFGVGLNFIYPNLRNVKRLQEQSNKTEKKDNMFATIK